jgi:hypothetical protein
MKKTGKSLARFYQLSVRSAYYHKDRDWYWNLEQFPGATSTRRDALYLRRKGTTSGAYTWASALETPEFEARTRALVFRT